MPRKKLSLSFDEWPANDRALWSIASSSLSVFNDEAKNCSYLSQLNREQLVKGYSLWLGFLKRSGLLSGEASPGGRVTRQTLGGFVKECTERVAYTTTHTRLSDLNQTLRFIDPKFDRAPIIKLMKRIKRHAHPTQNKIARLCTANELWCAGLERMCCVENRVFEKQGVKALCFMDGLIICLLAARPIRLGNLQSMNLGDHLTKNGEIYYLELKAEETKNKLAEFDPLPAELTPYMDRYLNHYRPLLLQGNSSQAVWISGYHRRASKFRLSDRIRKATKEELGKAVNPHLFRDCVATSIADLSPKNTGMASRLLNHRSTKTTENHYIHANRKLSALRWMDLVENRQKEIKKRQTTRNRWRT